MDIKFIVDQTAGKLARFLRLLGFDTEYFNSNDKGKLIERAKGENRILISRDKKLRLLYDDVFTLKSDNYYLQAIEVIEYFGLKDRIRPFTRCLECNTPLLEADRIEAKGKVPFYVWLTHDEFSKCPTCNRYYWEGTHTERLKEKIRRLKEKIR